MLEKFLSLEFAINLKRQKSIQAKPASENGFLQKPRDAKKCTAPNYFQKWRSLMITRSQWQLLKDIRFNRLNLTSYLSLSIVKP